MIKIEYIKEREEFLITWQDNSESFYDNIEDVFKVIKGDFNKNGRI